MGIPLEDRTNGNGHVSPRRMIYPHLLFLRGFFYASRLTTSALSHGCLSGYFGRFFALTTETSYPTPEPHTLPLFLYDTHHDFYRISCIKSHQRHTKQAVVCSQPGHTRVYTVDAPPGSQYTQTKLTQFPRPNTLTLKAPCSHQSHRQRKLLTRGHFTGQVTCREQGRVGSRCPDPT